MPEEKANKNSDQLSIGINIVNHVSGRIKELKPPVAVANSPFSTIPTIRIPTDPSEASDLYFLVGLLNDFRALNHDQKRKAKIGILKVLGDVHSSSS